MISFHVKIVLQVLPEPSVTTRFPTTSRPAGDEPDWAGHLDSKVNAQERRGTCGHVFVLGLALALDFAFSFIPSETPKASHRILPFADGHRVARGKMASHSEMVAPSPGHGLIGRTSTRWKAARRVDDQDRSARPRLSASCSRGDLISH